MRRLGVHTSIAGGMHLSLRRATDLGCSTVQFFSHNPRGWAVKKISEEDASTFRILRLTLGISPVFIHSSYLINMASKDKLLREKSINLLVTEMDRADAIGADYVVLHAGSSSGEDGGAARKRVVDALTLVSQSGEWNAGLLIENTAGERGDLCSGVEELSEIVNGVKGRLVSGVCLDTCHAFAAGHDVGSKQGIDVFLRAIGRHVGPDRVRLIHLNDSKGVVGSCIDRHEHIGLGRIGAEGLRRFVNHEALREVPLILETPKTGKDDDVRNLRRAKRMMRMKQ